MVMWPLKLLRFMTVMVLLLCILGLVYKIYSINLRWCLFVVSLVMLIIFTVIAEKILGKD